MTDTPLSRRQLATHIAATLPLGLLAGFLAGGLVYAVLMLPLPAFNSPFLSDATVVSLYRMIALLAGAQAGLIATAAVTWHAENVTTGIRLSDVYDDETDD